MVKDEEGNMCSTSVEQLERWRKHFTKILNNQNEFSAAEISRMQQRPTKPEMLPELCNTINKLRNRKAAGESSILPETVKAACNKDEILNGLLELESLVIGVLQYRSPFLRRVK